MKLKAIRNSLEKAIKDNDEKLKREMFDLLQKRYKEERDTNPESSFILQLINVMKQYDCPLDEEQKKKDEEIYRKPHSDSDKTGNASKLGASFTNPYTFMPFKSEKPIRSKPVPRTISEVEDRISGIIELDVKLLSHLLSPETKKEAQNNSLKDGHQSYKCLSIGDSVIYPATGVRGSLRHLMTVLTGGSLRYLDKELFLCDDRWDSNSKSEKNLQLGLIVVVGDRNKPGRIVLGRQKSIKVSELSSIFHSAGENLDEHRRDKTIWVKWDSYSGEPKFSFGENQPESYDKMLKLSGPPVGSYEKKLQKKEWVFSPDWKREITIPPELWVEYQSRYMHGPHGELKKGHIVWLEPTIDGSDFKIEDGGDVQSIQWAKWGKEGDRLADVIPEHVKPDYMTGHRDLVDEVCNLFGQVSPEKSSADDAPSFMGRIRPDNLVFLNSLGETETVTLPPLQPPHPGCKAFYRDKYLAKIRGYKVYRNTKESGEEAPFNYDQQPVFENGRKTADKCQKVNKTVELLKKGAVGKLNISFHSLSKREYALLRLVCSMPVRFGGGKPLGLGYCSLEMKQVRNEFGKAIDDPVADWKDLVSDLSERVKLYDASQEPVDKLRYPRAVTENNNKINRGGYVWFGLNAQLKSDKQQLRKHPVSYGSQLAGKIGSTLLDAQPLPELSLDYHSDLLYGYDMLFRDKAVGRERNRELYDVVPFIENQHIQKHHSPGPNTSLNREARRNIKKGR